MEPVPLDPAALAVESLRQQEARLQQEAERLQAAYAGLRDIELLLSLAAAKLALCVQLLKNPTADRSREIREKAMEALRLVDGLQAENLSEDQAGAVTASPRYAEVRARLQEFLLAGGGGLLEARQTDAKARRLLARAVASAVRRFAAADDRYPPLDPEEYPPLIRRALLTLFPVMVRRNPQKPPYGIEEGEEQTYSSSAMQMPLSQAIRYLEEELAPELERRLAENPGSAELQEQRRMLRERIEHYRSLRFFPRSTPVLLEKGYYTQGVTRYTADGELLVPVNLAVRFRSGTNLDRLMELVRMDVVRRLAGRGVSREIDRQYRYLRSLQSGLRGSSRTASMKLDAAWGYRVLKQEYPFLARLADKGRFLELVREVRTGGPSLERRLEALIEADGRTSRPRLPGM